MAIDIQPRQVVKLWIPDEETPVPALVLSVYPIEEGFANVRLNLIAVGTEPGPFGLLNVVLENVKHQDDADGGDPAWTIWE